MKLKFVLFLALSFFVFGCANSMDNWQEVASQRPKSMLVLPVLNNSLDVDAPNYVLTTAPVPIASRGYYVFPVNTTKTIFEGEGLYEPAMVHQQPPEKLASLFGADSILYITIQRWDARYLLLNTVVTVEFDYKLVDKKGATLWRSSRKMTYSPEHKDTGNAATNLISMAIKSAVTRAAPDYMPLARQANDIEFHKLPEAYYLLKSKYDKPEKAS